MDFGSSNHVAILLYHLVVLKNFYFQLVTLERSIVLIKKHYESSSTRYLVSVISSRYVTATIVKYLHSKLLFKQEKDLSLLFSISTLRNQMRYIKYTQSLFSTFSLFQCFLISNKKSVSQLLEADINRRPVLILKPTFIQE